MRLAEARAFVLRRQMLDGRSRRSGEPGAMGALRRLGFVQIDTINVVERAHHHTLWARVPDYRAGALERLQRRGRVFEYWAHAMCYLPMEDYRFYRRYMEEFPERSRWYRNYHEKYGKLAGEVMARIKAEGPLSTSDFDGPNRRQGGWWDWKPAKTALEMLLYRGDLMVSERRRFQKVYDLTERVIPPDIPRAVPSEQECRRYFIRRALSAMGLATGRDINKYITVAGRLDRELPHMISDGEVDEARLQGVSKPHYALAALVKEIRTTDGADGGVKLLSPFDNAVILRQRALELFSMDFAMECYMPAAKRRYGYFPMPILWRGRLVGRLDPKADREAGTLMVRSLHLEHRLPKAFYGELAEELESYAEFNGCSSVKPESMQSESAKSLARFL